jgi:hypothetical protein
MWPSIKKVAPDQIESGQSTFIADGVAPSARVPQTVAPMAERRRGKSSNGQRLPVRTVFWNWTGGFRGGLSVAPWSRQSVWRRRSPLRAPKLVATDVNVARIQEATAKFDATAVEPETIVMAKCDVLSPNALGANSGR